MNEVNPKAKEIMMRLKKSKSAKDKLIKEWKELDEFYRGDQYKNMNTPPWVPKPVTNFIHLVVTTKRAALSAENPMAMIRPLSAQDIEPVSQLQKVYEWVWERTNARSILRDSIESSKLLGTGIAHVYWDEMTGVLGGRGANYEGEIKMKEIDLMNFHIDPQAYRIEDASWIHVPEKRNKRWVEQQFNVSLTSEEAEKDNFGEGYARDYNNDDRHDKKSSVIDFHSHYEKYWNTEKVMAEQPVMDEVLGQVVGTKQVETDEEIGGWNYKVTYMAGNKVLDTIDPLEPNMYPFAVLYDFKQRQEFFGKGTASLIIDNQKLINKVESIVAMIGTLLQNPQKLISKQSGINPEEAMKYSSAPGQVWMVNGPVDGAMKWQDVPQIPPSLMNLAEAAKQNIREITGMNEAYMGQSVGSLQTSSGVNSLIDRSTMRDRDQIYDIEQFVEQLTRLLVAFATTKYSEERYIRFIEDPSKPESTTKFMEFIGTNYRDIEYDIEVDVSARAPITQARKEAELDNLLQLQGQYNYKPAIIIPQEYIKGKNMVDADKIIDRMNKEEAQNQIEQLTQVASAMAEAMVGGVPPEEVMKMAETMLQQIESGVAAVPGSETGGGIGSAANNIQAQQGSLQ